MNGNAIFQRMIKWVLRDTENSDPYIDDIIVSSTGDTEDELMAYNEMNFRKALNKLNQYELVADRKMPFCS